MKFSVLLPTRDRLEYLKYAIYSITSQNYGNWEVIISDNNSSEDIESYIKSLNDHRIYYSKTNEFISVTDNWNRCIEQCSGDYVIMLGDDDCLLNGYFSIVENLISEFSYPDFIYSNALIYAYPNVLPEFPKGRLQTAGSQGLWNAKTPYLLSQSRAKYLVNETMNFRMKFTYNMQFSTIRREFINDLKINGKFFHSPYPDYYATTLLMLKAKKILISPDPLTLIGISRKSFGYFYFNNQEPLGMNFINNKKEIDEHPDLKQIFLPGTAMNSCWLCSLYSLQKNVSSTHYLKINFNRYRRLQLATFYKSVKNHPKMASRLFSFLCLMKWWEITIYTPVIIFIYFLEKLVGANKMKKWLKLCAKNFFPHADNAQYQFKKEYTSPLEILKDIDPLNCFL